MEAEFEVPLHPADMMLRGEESEKYGAAEHPRLHLLPEAKASVMLDAIVDNLNDDPLKIIDHQNFDLVFNFLNQFPNIESNIRNRVISLVTTGLQSYCTLWRGMTKRNEIPPSVKVYRNALKLYVFLLYTACNIIEKDMTALAGPVAPKAAKGKSKAKVSEEWDWEGRTGPHVLTVLAEALDLDMTRLWGLSNPEESFISLFAKAATEMIENPVHVKTASTVASILTIFTTLVQRYEQGVWATTAIINLVHRAEHIVSPMARLMQKLADGDTISGKRTVGEIIREISKMDPQEISQDASGTKFIGLFLVEVAELIPYMILQHISILLPYLSNESYVMRNMIVQIIGYVVCKGLGDSKNPGMTSTRDELFDILEARFLDKNSFTRCKVLQTWQYLLENRAVPLKRLPHLTDLVAGRLHDSASTVRRNALKALCVMLNFNPYSGELVLSAFKSRLEAAEDTLKEVAKHDEIPLPPASSTMEKVPSPAPAKKTRKIRKSSDSESSADDSAHESGSDNEQPVAGPAPVVEETLPAELSEEDKKVAEARFQVAFLKDAVCFITRIEECAPVVSQLFGSKNVSDIVESIEFVKCSFMFKLDHGATCARKMLTLIWSKDPSVKEALLAAFKELHLTAPADTKKGNHKARAAFITKNLIGLTMDASLAELTSLEQLLAELRQQKQIDGHTVEFLWEVFSGHVQGASKSQVVGSLMVLSMLANADPGMIKDNMGTIVSVGLGAKGAEDERIARYACVALQKLVSDASSRLAPTHDLFARLQAVVVKESSDVDNWFSAAEQAINAVFVLCEEPEVVCADIVRALAAPIFGDDDLATQTVDSMTLSRVFFVVGHIALKELVHIEARHREHNKAKAKAEAGEAPIEAAPASKPAAAGKAKKARKGRVVDSDEEGEEGAEEADEMADELGMGAAAHEDAETEFLAEVTEKELVTSNLLGQFAPLIVAVCLDPVTFPDPKLRTSAVLALSKMMCVSGTFCESHLQVLFTVLSSSTDAVVRSNIVIALGDLAFRFPNHVEPWTAHIYGQLRDKDVRVRKNTLMVLTHLILNDMIKIKGQISEMAICLEDSEQRIADLASLFFHELSLKGNAIYNILPDTISRLCSDENVTKETFRSIMKYLFSFVQKDKQQESLIVKLCFRFKATNDPEQWRSIAYCLSLLSYSDKGVKKLSEMFKCYSDKLIDEEIYASFQTVLSKAKKFARAEMKSALEELEAKLGSAHVGQFGEGEDGKPAAEGDAESQAAAAPTKAPAKKAAKKTAKAAPKAKKAAGKKKGKVTESSEVSDVSSVSEEEEAPAVKAGVKRAKKAAASDSEEDVKPAGRGKTQAARNKKRIESSDEASSTGQENAVESAKGKPVAKSRKGVLAPAQRA